MSVSEWSPPETLDEYHLVRLLGRGAMGAVYLAHDQLLDRPVAVKFVPGATDPDVRARVFEEARAIARLQHPNVVAIYRVAEVAGHPYLVSEYVRGTPLDQLERPVASKTLLPLAIDLARGLAAAHRSGVLHRDVKPANAIVTEEGRGKLLDFGLARVLDSEAPEPVAPALRSETRPSDRHLATIDATVSSIEVPVAAGSSQSDEDSFDPEAKDRSINLQVGGSPKAAGTPLYMAPELWRGEPATRRTDLYAFGIMLYELLSGTAPHRGIAMAELGDAVQHRDVPPLREVSPALAAVVDRLIARDATARFASADELVLALEECDAPRAVLPDGNPYRGLAAFESSHGAVFFGRRGEVRELVDRVLDQPLVVVGGDSGTGKSSLCRAGVLPSLVEQGWDRLDVIPGRQPVKSLANALAGWLGIEVARVVELIEEGGEALAREVRKSAAERGKRLLVFVDQLEELLAISDPAQARLAAAALAGLGEHAMTVRVLATARSDFLSRLATLPGLREEMGRALYFLLPLTAERIREVIVRPAQAKGVAFESEALVDTLVEQTGAAAGGLPLLQFTLAELWDGRDEGARVIRADALAAAGGVGGALTRHADRLLAGLDVDRIDAARRLLLRLVTADGTRARRTEEELLVDEHERAALEVLVRGRIVVANDAQQGAYEIAHEALLTSWETLQEWRRQSVADHAVRLRVEHAAAAWQRMGRPRDLLWARRQIREADLLERDALAPREAAFLSASRNALVRKRLIALAVTVAVIAVAAITVVVIRSRARAQLESVIAEQVRTSNAAFAEARELGSHRDAARDRAFALFDRGRWPEAEEAWTEAQALREGEAAKFRAASRDLENALSLDPSRETSRALLADLLAARLQRAERDRDAAAIDELSGRLVAYDDEGRYRKALADDAKLALSIEPPNASITLERGPTRTPIAPGTRELAALEPGHVTLVVEAPGSVAVRYPILLRRGETARVAFTLPLAAKAPTGMVYIPAGPFLFGSDDGDDLRRGFLNAAPLHEVVTPSYWIARHEVTFADWIGYLDELPADERKRRIPSSVTPNGGLELIEVGPRKWRLEITPTIKKLIAEQGQPLIYEKRDRRRAQDWSKFPVTAISVEDADAYAAWLAKTGRIPGARLCDEYEWERAGRGADGRTFPTGTSLAPDDANVDVTYGREPLAFGPDEVGAHPQSRSVFGVDDLAGNAWEWTRSVAIPGTPVLRGGGWYNAILSSRSVNRELAAPSQRNVLIGIRLCAAATPG